MSNTFDSNNVMSARQPKYIEIRNYLYSLIKNNFKTVDYKLPSENMVMMKFGVSRITAKQAFTQLEIEGLIVRRQGKGTFINSTLADFPDQKKLYNKIIGIILPDLKSSFMSQLIDGIETYARNNDYMVMIANSHYSQEIEASIIQKYHSIGITGIILYPVEGTSYNKEMMKLVLNSFPLILLDKKLTGLDIPSVSSDHCHDAMLLTEHLISLGHTNIGVVISLDKDSYTVQQRLKGHKASLKQHGLIFENRRVLTDISNSTDSFKRLDEFMNANPTLTALIAIDHSTGVVTLSYLLKKGIAVPDQIALTAFDDIGDDFDNIYKCPITCISQDTLNIGKYGAKLVIKQIENPYAVIDDILLKSQLIVKESSKKLPPPRSEYPEPDV